MEWQNGQIPGQVEVHYYGYDKAFDAWVSLNMLKSKALPKDKKVRHSGGKELWCAKRSQINTIIMQVLHLENTHGKKTDNVRWFRCSRCSWGIAGPLPQSRTAQSTIQSEKNRRIILKHVDALKCLRISQNASNNDSTMQLLVF